MWTEDPHLTAPSARPLRSLGPPLSVCNVMITWHFTEVMIRKKCKELLSTI